jgi:hypothetical protein
MTKLPVYEIGNLEDAREFLANYNGKIILTNKAGAIRYYGILVIDYMLKALMNEYPNKIAKIIIDVDDNHAALITALKLNYDNIVYKGNSAEANKVRLEYILK